MAGGTYDVRALVLRKTKLGETDLILTLLAEDGRQLRAVAKGARKPSSSFSSRLEIFSEVDLLMVQGKSLDIVKEARLVDAHMGVRLDMEHAAAAAPMADLMARLSQPDLVSPKLYPLTVSALKHAGEADASAALSICAAHMLKAFAFAGFRPSLDRCVGCGKLLDLVNPGLARTMVPFSAAEGGAVCPSCLLFTDTVHVSTEVLTWSQFLMLSTFDDVVQAGMERRVSFEILQLCQMWVREHVGSRLKSLEFLFTYGLF